MTLTLEQAAASVVKLQQAAETAVARDGRSTGTLALILPDAGISAVVPFGPGGERPSDEFVVAQSVARGIVGLALTGEYWTDLAQVTGRQAFLTSRDLPPPSQVHGERRGEEIMTTAVVFGEDRALRCRTPIQRTVFGVNLGERTVTYEDAVMPDGVARRLIAVLERVRDTAR